MDLSTFSRFSSEDLSRNGIYRIYRVDGDPKDEYIGQAAISFKVRWRRHYWALVYGQNTRHLQRAWDLYGPDKFDIEILEFVDDTEQLDTREQWYIDTRKPRYNLCLFVRRSRLGVKASDETIAKMRLAQKGHRPPPSAIANSVARRKGQRHTQEHIAKRIATTRERGMTEKRRASFERRRGVPLGPKPFIVRQKISQTKTGMPWSVARRAAHKPHDLSSGEIARLEAGRAYQQQRSQERNDRVWDVLQKRGWIPIIPLYLMSAAHIIANELSFSRDSAYKALKHFVNGGTVTCVPLEPVVQLKEPQPRVSRKGIPWSEKRRAAYVPRPLTNQQIDALARGRSIDTPERAAARNAYNATKKKAAAEGTFTLTPAQIAANQQRRGSTLSVERRKKVAEGTRRSWVKRRTASQPTVLRPNTDPPSPLPPDLAQHTLF